MAFFFDVRTLEHAGSFRGQRHNAAHRQLETSLSAAAKIATERHGYKWAAIAGPDYWLHDGKSLTEIRYEMESNAD